MSDLLIFNLLRRKKREWGKTQDGLTQAEVDEINAVLRDYKKSFGGTETPAKAPPALPPKVTGLKDPGAFYAALRASLGPFAQSQVDGFNFLLGAMGSAGWPVSWVAYALATTWHETAHTMQPISELGGTAYFTRLYDVQGRDPARAKKHGNTAPGDGPRYRGRGYVQLTWKNNYADAGAALGEDLVGNPDLAKDPLIAAKILVWGMAGGKFTGKGLKDYLPAQGPANHHQFVLARYIINGQDKASAIADLALKFQTALTSGQWS